VLYELRTYLVRPGHLPTYVRDFEQRGLPVIRRYAQLVGYWTTEVGPLNEVVHLWAYRDAQHRAEQRAKLYADVDWAESYLPSGSALVMSQNSRLLTATEFSPLR
jgi:NIPSNAP